ncbi:tyrosine-type recombinase/integrase [Fundidesulfovibrio butyratiphilus]
MEKLCEKAGVKTFSYHTIRHLFASILYRERQPVSVIQAILRHKSPTTTTRYLHGLGLNQTREALSSVMDGRGGGRWRLCHRAA